MFKNIESKNYWFAFLNMALAGVNGVSCMKMFKGTIEMREKYKSLLKK
jgi:hypothetical protein